jgi:F-type H+-transporting ATPase subunit epsilon
MTTQIMRLKILLPNEIFFEGQVAQINAEAVNGHFCLLPHHVDFVAAMVPGLLTHHDERGGEHFVAVDDGTLVKCGYEVLVSTRSAIASDDLGSLNGVVENQFQKLDEREKLARSASARLEASLVRRFMELEKLRA